MSITPRQLSLVVDVIAKKHIAPIIRRQRAIIDISTGTLRQGMSETPSNWRNDIRKLDRNLTARLPVATTEEQALELSQKHELVYFRKGQQKFVVASSLGASDTFFKSLVQDGTLGDSFQGLGSVSQSQARASASRAALEQLSVSEGSISKMPSATALIKKVKEVDLNIAMSRKVQGKTPMGADFSESVLVTAPSLYPNVNKSWQKDLAKELKRTLNDSVKKTAKNLSSANIDDIEKQLAPYITSPRIGGKATSEIKRLDNMRKAVNTVIAGSNIRQGKLRIRSSSGTFTSLTKLITNANNGALVEYMRKAMGKGASSSVLNWRTGRLARSARIEGAEMDRDGNISNIQVSYMYAPYSTFDVGGKQHRSGRETPPRTINRAVRMYFLDKMKANISRGRVRAL